MRPEATTMIGVIPLPKTSSGSASIAVSACDGADTSQSVRDMGVRFFLRKPVDIRMIAVPLPLRPVMVFNHAEEAVFAAAFLQNSAQRLHPGSHAEVVFPAVPGRVFQAKVTKIQEGIAQGQVQPTGTLIDPEKIKGEGRVLVALEFEDDLSPYQLVPGTTGSVAVYTEHMHHLSVIRKVLLRMNSWTNYLFSDGH